MAKISDVQIGKVRCYDENNNSIVETRCFFTLTGCSNDEIMMILKYKSWIFKSWKTGTETKYFCWLYKNNTNEKILWCYVGFAPILIRYLQSLGYIINGKELFRSKEIMIGNMKFDMWKHQIDAINAWCNRGSYGVIKIPTGGGKSLVACKIIEKLRLRTIICVHTKDLLINIWFNTLVEQFGLGIKSRIGIIGGGLSKVDRKEMRIIDDESYEENVKKDIVIATSQSLLTKLDKLCNEKFGLFVFDEVHHVAAEQFRKVASNMRSPFRLGLSVSGDTYIPIVISKVTSKQNIRKDYKVMRIDDLYDKYKNNNVNEIIDISAHNIKTFSFNEIEIVERKKVIESNITHVHRYKKNDKRIYQIKTETGRSIKVTEDHSLFKLIDEYNLRSIRTDELKVGDFLAVPSKKINLNNCNDIKNNRNNYNKKMHRGHKHKKEKDYILSLYNSNMCFDKIRSIELVDDNIEYVYDISVDVPTHNFIGNNIFCHNSATLQRPDGMSPVIYGLLGNLTYKIKIKELVDIGILVEPVFNSIIVNDEKTQNKINSCGLTKLELIMYMKKMSACSEIKRDYILDLVRSLVMNKKKFIMYADYINDKNNIGIFTRDYYVDILNRIGIRTYGISAKMSGSDRGIIFDMLEKGKLDGVVMGKLGSEGVNIPTIDCIIMNNSTGSPITFPQRTGRAMRSLRIGNKKNAFIYEILLNNRKELEWSNVNFYEYESEGYTKERKYIKSEQIIRLIN